MTRALEKLVYHYFGIVNLLFLVGLLKNLPPYSVGALEFLTFTPVFFFL